MSEKKYCPFCGFNPQCYNCMWSVLYENGREMCCAIAAIPSSGYLDGPIQPVNTVKAVDE